MPLLPSGVETLPHDETSPDPRAGDYFVSAIDGRKYALISGPYASHAAALADKLRVQRAAADVDRNAPWWAWGTCRLEVGSGELGALQKAGLEPLPGARA